MSKTNNTDNFEKAFDNVFGTPKLAYVNGSFYERERLLRSYQRFLQHSPELKGCNPLGVLAACVTVIDLGLDPDPRLQHVRIYPVPNYRKSSTGDYCRLSVRTLGIVTLAERIPTIQKIHARLVYEDDTFSYEYGLKPELVHIPSRNPYPDSHPSRDPRAITHTYAGYTGVTGQPAFFVTSVPKAYEHAPDTVREAMLKASIAGLLSQINLGCPMILDGRHTRFVPEPNESLALLRALQLEDSVFGQESVTEELELVPVESPRCSPWDRSWWSMLSVPSNPEQEAPPPKGRPRSTRRRSNRKPASETSSTSSDQTSPPGPTDPPASAPEEQGQHTTEADTGNESNGSEQGQTVTRPKRSEQLGLPKVQ